MNARVRWLPTAILVGACVAKASTQAPRIGDERAVPHHLQDGDESRLSIVDLIAHGRTLFCANWTEEDGAGRPLTRGSGAPLADPRRPLIGARGFNRLSGPDANSCQGCHNAPSPGGHGDVVANAMELAERFDFVTFDRQRPDDETLETIGDLRATPGLYGAGYVEMLARAMTRELQRQRDGVAPGQSKRLAVQGISFGTLSRRRDGSWDAHAIAGLPPQSVSTDGGEPPTLVIRPWRQSATVASLRELTNSAYNQHLGIQTTERFGVDTDPDGDGVSNEMTRADVTAVVLFQATLPVPGRVIPNDPAAERAIADGERIFDRIRCTSCHVPSLRLDRADAIYTEPGVRVDLSNRSLPQPRLGGAAHGGAIDVPAYSDFKLHDITDPADASAAEPIDMNQPAGSREAAAGNRRFLTRRLWGAGNQGPYFHHGRFTTMRQAIFAHAGEAAEPRAAFERLARADQDALIEFLKSLDVLPPTARTLVVDERGQPKEWPR